MCKRKDDVLLDLMDEARDAGRIEGADADGPLSYQHDARTLVGMVTSLPDDVNLTDAECEWLAAEYRAHYNGAFLDSLPETDETDDEDETT